MAAHTCNSSTQERQEDCEFEASLDYVNKILWFKDPPRSGDSQPVKGSLMIT